MGVQPLKKLYVKKFYCFYFSSYLLSILSSKSKVFGTETVSFHNCLQSLALWGHDLGWHLYVPLAAWQQPAEICQGTECDKHTCQTWQTYWLFFSIIFACKETPHDISAYSVFEIVIGRTIEGHHAHSEEKQWEAKIPSAENIARYGIIILLDLIRQANRQEESKEKTQWGQKLLIMTGKLELLTISLVIKYYSITSPVSQRM